ncbi:MAG: TRC40/GET3/ArsA family transport-energizing ATPase, partial [Solirubrobacteraceae bacterium]
MHPTLLDDATRVLFFTGKGGMGKTTLACATAVTLAASGRRILIVSTDPASNLDEVLQTDLGQTPRPVRGVAGLDALNIDPEAAAVAHRERAVAPFRGVLPDTAIASMEESLSGACTVEIAAFDAFAGLLGDATATSAYEHAIFDTAPTGHTLRLLSLPGAWTNFIDTNTTGASCLGPLAGLQAQRELYGAAVAALGDPAMTTLVLVSRPERSALTEAARASSELRAAGMTCQLLLVNGVLEH